MTDHSPPASANQMPPTVRNVKTELEDLDEMGFHEGFKVKPGGEVECGVCGHVAAGRDVEIIEVRRVEGQSDPADMAAVIGLRCKGCAHEGTLVLTYGPSASADDADVLQQLDGKAWKEAHR
jgi:hypothetical protein